MTAARWKRRKLSKLSGEDDKNWKLTVLAISCYCQDYELMSRIAHAAERRGQGWFANQNRARCRLKEETQPRAQRTFVTTPIPALPRTHVLLTLNRESHCHLYCIHYSLDRCWACLFNLVVVVLLSLDFAAKLAACQPRQRQHNPAKLSTLPPCRRCLRQRFSTPEPVHKSARPSSSQPLLSDNTPSMR